MISFYTLLTSLFCVLFFGPHVRPSVLSSPPAKKIQMSLYLLRYKRYIYILYLVCAFFSQDIVMDTKLLKWYFLIVIKHFAKVEETWVIKMCIWCIKIVNVLVLQSNSLLLSEIIGVPHKSNLALKTWNKKGRSR
jgi:hypothetical protein